MGLNLLRCAVLGLGRQGSLHAVNLATKIARAELFAVADTMPEVAAQFARLHGVAHAFTDPLEAIHHPDVDAVVVVTPTQTHFSLIQEALSCGKAVFAEKPLAATLQEAKVIQQMVDTSGAYLQVGFMRRFDPAYAHARDLIAQGAVGTPLYFKAVSRDPACPPAAYIKASGGIFADMCVHDFDIARFLMGSEIVRVQSMGKVVANAWLAEHGDVDQAMTYLEFASGATGDVEGNRNAGYGYDIRGEVVGTAGAVQIGSVRQHDVRLLSNAGETMDIIPGFLERFADAYVREMVDFVDRVLAAQAPAVTAADGVAALAIAQAATESWRSGTAMQVDVPL